MVKWVHFSLSRCIYIAEMVFYMSKIQGKIQDAGFDLYDPTQSGPCVPKEPPSPLGPTVIPKVSQEQVWSVKSWKISNPSVLEFPSP